MSEEALSSGGQGWLAKADDDLRVARIVLRGEIGVEWAACFHAQQAVEKALKGVLVHLGIDFPKSHSLDRLIALMPDDIAELFDLNALIELTPWAVAGRYPEDIHNPTADQALTLVDSAVDIVQAAKAATREV